MKLIVSAGMVRSGSTWLYNVLRHVYLCDEKRVYGSYETDYDPAMEADIHVVKTHRWRSDLYEGANAVFTTWRDLRDVAASIVRRGWCREEIITPYVREVIFREYNLWHEKSTLEVCYPVLVSDPLHEIQRILDCLELTNVCCEEVARDIDKLGRCVSTVVSPITQIWPGHVTDGRIGSYRETLSEETVRSIEALSEELNFHWRN